MQANRLVTILSTSIGIALSLAAFEVSAQPSGAMADGQMANGQMANDQMGMPAPAGDSQSPSTQAFKQNAARMMKNMSAPAYTGDADADFVAHMIPHHQGAVDQAKVELKYGVDPKMRALAANIIKTQQEEISYMKQWQVMHKKGM
ncbi:CopM family metallochaperone [Pararobbsia alpina]|uniref:DUF305 domain-containing protein n=1 Tax=Pararobbsia alpina TaxID=621374 RepID=A0A6S7BIG1_9BURK|nr:DUF305 domain-containing protein [Pararobbsia alpina]CAB3799905.1 hypothetical protein LMG28138_04759 [Pararobbsia alpina]